MVTGHPFSPSSVWIAIVTVFAAFAGCASAPPADGNATNSLVANARDDAFQFDVPESISAETGVPWQYSFCWPVPETPTSPCGPMPPTENPTGGQAPYHFQLDSGTGFPPMGLHLGKDGLLDGTISATEAGKTRIFVVCAVDLSGDQVCREVTLIIEDLAPCAGDMFSGSNWTGAFDIGPGAYKRTFDFTFGDVVRTAWGTCTVPVASVHVNDAKYPWILDSKAVSSAEPSELSCDEAKCDTFHLILGLPNGPPVDEVSGGRALRMDAVTEGFRPENRMDDAYIGGTAGTGGYGGGCCWAGSFTSTRVS